MFEVMLGDPRSWGDEPELVAALRAEHAVEELPDPDIDLPTGWPTSAPDGPRERRW